MADLPPLDGEATPPPTTDALPPLAARVVSSQPTPAPVPVKMNTERHVPTVLDAPMMRRMSDTVTDVASLPLRLAIYGATKVGKTFFCNTFPKPIYLAPVAEATQVALVGHPNQDAMIWNIPEMNPETQQPTGKGVMASMLDAVESICQNHAAWGIKTVVVDTATMYIDLLCNELTRYGERPMWGRKGEDNHWQTLYRHLVEIRDKLHSTPLHVIWTFHEEQDLEGIRPKVSGKKALPDILATCQSLIYLEKYDVPMYDETGQHRTGFQTHRRMWLRQPSDSNFIAATRWEERFPEGFYQPHFEVFRRRLLEPGNA